MLSPPLSCIQIPCIFCNFHSHQLFTTADSEQVLRRDLTIPELSPSYPTSNTNLLSSSAPVRPLGLPPFATALLNPLVHGKHQPNPRPFKPVSKNTSRGTVHRARQVLLSLEKCKRWPSTYTGILTGMQPTFTAYDAPDMLDSTSQPKMGPSAPSQVSPPIVVLQSSLL